MPVFTKDVLAPGTYRAMGTDGRRKSVTYTAADMHHFARRLNEMIRARRQVPCCWAHQDDSKPTTPGDRAALEAKNNLGHVIAAAVTRAGLLEMQIDVPNPDDAARLDSVRYVSPEVLPDFEDGAGRLWPGRSITHVALTPSPVRHRQGPFIPVRMGHGGRGGLPPHPPWGLGVRLSLSDREGGLPPSPPLREKPMADKEESDEAEGGGEGAASVPLDKLMEALASKGISLPPETTDENFREYLYVALHATGGETVPEEEPVEEEAEAVGEAPGPMLMALRRELLAERNDGLARRIDALERRKFPGKVVANLRRQLTGERLSLTKTGQVVRSALANVLDQLEEFSADNAAARFGIGGGDLSRLKEAAPPAGTAREQEDKEMREWAREQAKHVSVKQ